MSNVPCRIFSKQWFCKGSPALHGISPSVRILTLVILSPLLGYLLHSVKYSQILGGNSNVIHLNVSGLCTFRGLVKETAYLKRKFWSFTGVQYGEIHTRFQPGKLNEQDEKEDAICDATLPQNPCMQPVLRPFLYENFTEDCLTLNIFTPEKKIWRNNPLPVIVFFHGGSFFRWSGSMFDARRLLDRDVVFISVNYRLNVFGFFCLGIDEAPGNLGLYDQILALQWIQKYVRYFGGDPGRVTISGQSAGAAAVTYLMDSPLAKGLFHGVIASSGDSFAGWSIEHNPVRNSLTAAKALGCANGTSAEGQDLEVVLNCMRSQPAYRILDSLTSFFSAPVVQDFPLTKVKKVLDQRTKPGKPRLLSHLPTMIGLNKNDGSFLLSRIHAHFLKAKNLHENSHYLKSFFVRDLLTSSHFGFVDKPNGTVVSLARSFLGNALNSGSFEVMAPGLTDIYSRYYFTEPALETARTNVKAGGEVYIYVFEYEGEQTLYPYMGGIPEVPRGVTHADDSMYLFHFGEFSKKEEWEISRSLIDFWVNFASTGNPNHRTTELPRGNELWPKFEDEGKLGPVLRILGANADVGHLPNVVY